MDRWLASLSARRAWIEMSICVCWTVQNRVALRKESVDRNILHMAHLMELLKSLSARRAWIEIGNSCTQAVPLKVALRKESVDRNFHVGDSTSALPRSLSARRAWIEILCPLLMFWLFRRRSPQGERG